jgi:putative membrane protein
MHWIVSGLALAVAAALTPGFRIRGFSTALFASLLIGGANIVLKPLLVFLTLPLTIITLGLFLFVVDAIILRICAAFLKDFEITGWISAIIGAVFLALTSSLLHWLFI